ncbi:hypothetical protein SRABI128_06104 [Microbacterium sp. Bi128]|nr:hypothetical protein SRABI128_06104 [Microbacterium sp. Bi128]
MRVDVGAGGDDHVGAAAQHVQGPVGEVALVTHGVPAVETAQRLAVVTPQVAVADHAAADADVAVAAVREFGAVVAEDADFDAGKGLPDAGPARLDGLARAQPGARDEAELGGAVVLENGRVGGPAPGRLQRPGVQLGTGADDAANAGGIDTAGKAPLAEQPEHGGHQDQAGDAVVADGRVGGTDVEVVQAVELGAGIQAFGEGVEVQACRERPGSQGLVVLRQCEEFDGGLEGFLPGPPRAGERLGHRGRAGRQADQERGLRRPVDQERVRPGNCTRRTRFRPGDAGGDAVLELLGPGRVQHGALPLTSHGRGERYGEVG